MKKGRVLFAAFAFALLLAGCGNLDKGITRVADTTDSAGNITTGRVDSSVYQAVMIDGSYQTAAARELNASRMNSGYNQDNFESGLLRLSKAEFSVDTHYFQEGQKIPASTIQKWVGRKSDENPEGLNPKEASQPLIFQQLMEQNYLGEDGTTLKGLSLGLAFNSVYYDGNTQTAVSRDQIMANARTAVNTILANVRQIAGCENIPILIALFEQSSSTDLAGGSYIFKAVSKDGGTAIDSYDRVDEAHVALPAATGVSNLATEDGLSNKFVEFRKNVTSFFPNLGSVTGIADYEDGRLTALSLTVLSKYYTKTEVISYTQYLAKQAEAIFDYEDAAIEVQINTVENSQAYLIKNPGEKKVTAHVFR